MKTVIFDFDGTIANSFNEVVEIAYHLTKHPRLTDPKEVEKIREHPLAELAEEIKVPKYKWPYLLFRGRSLMAKVIRKVEPFPGINDTIVGLHKSGYQLLLMSSNSTKNVQRFLKNNNLNQYFLKIYGGVGLFGKSGALRRILKVNNLVSSDAIYIGDEPRDIEAAKANEMQCIAVSWGFNAEDLLVKNKPFKVAKTPKDIRNIIKDWANEK